MPVNQTPAETRRLLLDVALDPGTSTVTIDAINDRLFVYDADGDLVAMAAPGIPITSPGDPYAAIAYDAAGTAINTESVYIRNNSIGVGTNNPGQPIDIQKTLAGVPTFRLLATDTPSFMVFQVGLNNDDGGSVGTRFLLEDAGTNGQRWEIGTGMRQPVGDFLIYSSDGATVVSHHTSDGDLEIPNGRIGIGTDDTSRPDHEVHAKSAGNTRIRVESTAGTGAASFDMINQSATTPYHWIFQGLAGDGRFRIFDAITGTTGLHIDQGGNAVLGPIASPPPAPTGGDGNTLSLFAGNTIGTPATDTSMIQAIDYPGAGGQARLVAVSEDKKHKWLVPTNIGQVLGAAQTNIAADWDVMAIVGDSGGNNVTTLTGTQSYDGADIFLRIDSNVTLVHTAAATTDTIDLGGSNIVGPARVPLHRDNGKWYSPSGVNHLKGGVRVALTTYDAEPSRSSETNLHGGLVSLATGQALDSVPTNIVVSKGIGKILIVVNAGSDVSGSITVTGTSVDRETGAETGADTDTITVDATTTDSSDTDTNGNTRHALTGAYITSKWFRGSVTLSTADLTLTDVDVYHVSFEQFNDAPTWELDTFDANIFTTNANAEFDAYLYSIQVTGDKADVTREASINVGADGATAIANRYERLRRGNLGVTLDGTTDGVWADVHYSNSPAYVEDVTIKIWALI